MCSQNSARLLNLGCNDSFQYQIPIYHLLRNLDGGTNWLLEYLLRVGRN